MLFIHFDLFFLTAVLLILDCVIALSVKLVSGCIDTFLLLVLDKLHGLEVVLHALTYLDDLKFWVQSGCVKYLDDIEIVFHSSFLDFFFENVVEAAKLAASHLLFLLGA